MSMSTDDMQSRPWRVIAIELVAEQNRERIAQLTDELTQALMDEENTPAIEQRPDIEAA